MISNILVALDYGDTCHHVFAEAVALAKATQAQLRLLNVLDLERDDSLTFSPYSDRDWQSYAERYKELGTGSFKQLETFYEKAKAAGVETEMSQQAGSPGSVICKFAKAAEVDLIVVGSHGRRGLNEMLLGSVSNYVMHHAPCSVWVVHQSGVKE